MMPLNAIARLKQTVNDDWESLVADRMAALWGYSPGTAKWWRSSASHVFVLPDPRGKRYLRFVPDDYRDAESFAAVADLMARLADRGVLVARPVPSEDGPLVATADTPMGTMHAMVVEAAPGAALDEDDLDEPTARAWGAALASLHHEGADLGEDLPGPFGELSLVKHLFPADTELLAAATVLEARMRELPRESSGFGVVHGDFELDNLAWQDGTATAFDFDEACRSWFAADVAFALRDLTDHTGRPAAEHRERFAAFLDGYRSVRPIEAADLPLFAGLHAITALVQITRALWEPGENEPEWKAELRQSLTEMTSEHRRLAVTTAERYRTLEDLEGEPGREPQARTVE